MAAVSSPSAPAAPADGRVDVLVTDVVLADGESGARLAPEARLLQPELPVIYVSGFTREELIGSSHNIIRHPDMPEAAFADLWATVKKGLPWRGLVKNRCKNGDFYWVDAFVVPIKSDGRIIGYQSVRTPAQSNRRAAAEAAYRAAGQTGSLPRTGCLLIGEPSCERRNELLDRALVVATVQPTFE